MMKLSLGRIVRRVLPFLFLMWALPALAQKGKVSLDRENTPARIILNDIERQTDYLFVFNESQLDFTVSIKAENENLSSVLTRIFQEHDIEYALEGKHIVLRRKSQESSNVKIETKSRVDVSGVVRDENGQAVIGASVIQEGTLIGEITDAIGQFVIHDVPVGARLKIEYLGYNLQMIEVAPNMAFQTIDLTPATQQIDAVVVTALGITRKEKSLGYAVSKVSSEDLGNTDGGNWLAGMAGKVAGLNMDQSSAGPGGSVRVTLRGESSLSHDNNTALFVVDGVPINSSMTANSSSGSYDSVDAPIDYGNGAGDINPDDIASVSVLKGPAATALYGSRAANGAIVITTKSGKKQKGLGITFSTGVTTEIPGYWPDFQYEYGAGDYRRSTLASHMSNGISPDEYSFYTVAADKSYSGTKISAFHSRYQFGEKVEGQLRYMYKSYDRESGEYTLLPYEVCDWYIGFFEPGLTFSNSIAVDASDGKGSQLRVSVKDTRSDWIVPNTGHNTQSFNVSASSKRNRYVEAALKLTYYRKDSDNLPISGYSNSTPLKSLLWQPVSASVEDLYNEWKNGDIVAWNSGQATDIKLCDSSLDNPYFVAYEHLNTMDRDRVYGNLSVTGHIIPDCLSLALRAGVDFQNDFRTQQKPQYSHAYLSGMYREQTVRNLEFNTDFLLSFHKTIKDFYLSASFGGNAMMQNSSNVSLLASQLVEPNVFILQNVNGQIEVTSRRYRKAINSLYGFISASWKDMIFLDITGRNDWSSTLAPGNNSYFYPSVSGSILLDELFSIKKKAAWVDMIKIRASWANVGNDTDPYNLIASYKNSSNFTGSYYIPSETLNYYIKPENVESWEAGIELSFFKRRISVDAAWYSSSTTDQIINIPSDWSTGAASTLINAGRVDNKGIELAISFMPLASRNWKWSIDINWSKNWNRLVELAEGVSVWQLNANNTCGSRVYIYAYPGQELGRIYGVGYERAPEGAFYYAEDGSKIDCSGQVIVNATTGNPVLGTELKDLGSIYPDWTGGLQTCLKYKTLSISASFAASMGGRAYSLTNAILGYMGKTTASLPGRYDGLVHEGVNLNPDGTYTKNTTITTDIVEYYNLYVLNRNNVESNTFDTSYLKMKELRVDYSLPEHICEKTKVFRSISLGLFANNLFCITKWPQFDPEVSSMSGSSLYRGVETGSYPMTRSFGFNLKLGF